MNIEPEKPKESRHSPCASSEHAKLKKYLKAHDVVLQYLEMLLLDAKEQLTHYRQADYSRDVATLRRRYASEGLSFATKTLPNLFGEFLNHLEDGKPSYSGFKLDRSGIYPVFLRQLFHMASSVDDVDGVTAFRCLYQTCCAFKKLKGPYRSGTLCKQLWSFVDTDISLRYLDFDTSEAQAIINKAESIITNVVGDLDPFYNYGAFVPRPGPGATNAPRRKNVRYRPHVLYKQLDEVFPYEEWFFTPNPWDLATEPARYTTLRRSEAPSSRFKFVDKTYAKPRGICIEELETQYLQQGIKRALYDRMESHPVTRGRVNFTDQSINGRLALTSSATMAYATIDMSEASDRISRRLVERLFKGAPALREALLATSTRTIELPEDIPFIREFPCEKFAPMGSAVCFPVMSLVHFALIRGILSMCGHHNALAHDVYVYGDDILVRSECVEDVYKWLPLFGMKINVEKSYFRSRFRESCGVHAFNGCDITPVFFKYVPKIASHFGEVLSFRSVERDLHNKGFRRTASFLRSETMKVKKLKGVPLPFVSPKSSILGWIREKDDAMYSGYKSLRHRLVRKGRDGKPSPWREPVYLTRVIRPLSDDLLIIDDRERYLRWLTDHPNPQRVESSTASSDNQGVSAPRLSSGDPVTKFTGGTQPPKGYVRTTGDSFYSYHLCQLPLSDFWMKGASVDYALRMKMQENQTESVMESQDDFKVYWAWCPGSAF